MIGKSKEYSRRGLMVAVALLYMGEGLPAGIFRDLVDVWLLQARDVELTTLSLFSLLAIPWSLKALWSPLVDRLGTAARWTSLALLGVACASALVPHLALGPPLWICLGCLTLCSATADVAIDGYTTAVVPDSLQGRINGVRVAAYRAAKLLAGAGAIALHQVLPWSAVFGLVGLGVLILAGWCTRLPTRAKSTQPTRAWLSDFGAWLSQPGSWAIFLFVPLFRLGDAALGKMINPFWLRGAALSEAELATVSIGGGAALTVLGALVGGEITTRIGIFRALWMLGAVQALSNLGYTLAALDPQPGLVYSASLVESFCSGLGFAAFLAFLMRLCEHEQTATRFATLSALSMFTGEIVAAVSGFGVEAWGYARWFGLSFVLALPAFALLPAVGRRLRRIDERSDPIDMEDVGNGGINSC